MVDPDAVRNLRFGPYGLGDGRFDGTAFLDALQVVKNHFVSGLSLVRTIQSVSFQVPTVTSRERALPLTFT